MPHTQHNAHRSGRSSSLDDTLRNAADDVRETVDQARRRAGEAYERASSWAEERYDAYGRRSRQSLYGARSSAERFVSENPALVGVMGLAAGLLLGSLLPRTRHEDRAFGHWADEVRDQGLRYAREATQRGREFVEETLNTVADQVDKQANDGGSGTGPQDRPASPQGGAGLQGGPTGTREGPSGRHQNF